MQGGLELIGVPGAEGEAEVLALTVAALDEAGLRRHRVGVGDARSTGGCCARSTCRRSATPAARVPCAARPRGPRAGRHRARAGARSASLLALPELRGGPEVLDRAEALVPEAVAGLRALHALLAERGVADRVIFDLGLVRELGYYTGAVFEVYDPAVGFTLGGGGRYDDLLGRFGRASGLRHRARRPARAPGPGRRGGAALSDSWSPCRAGRSSSGTLDLLDPLGLDMPRCARTTASSSSTSRAS